MPLVNTVIFPYRNYKCCNQNTGLIKDEDVNQTLLRLQEEVDLLIILPHEHNIIERMFFRLHTEPLLRQAQKPVLTIRG
jgi:hypothetical protein